MNAHEPRAACIDLARSVWIGTCSRGCCKGERRSTAAEAMADARLLIEGKEIEASNARADAFWRTHSRTAAQG